MTSNTPRLYIDQAFQNDTPLALDKAQAHYLINVMRLPSGSDVRIFNGHDGEWLAKIADKKTLILLQQTKPQPENTPRVHLYFSPLKKDRTHMLVEKTTELGVTDLHPILCDHTNTPSFRPDKTLAHIIEASEQCERLTIPRLHPIQKLSELILSKDFYVAMERTETSSNITPFHEPHILIGPEGGWSDTEKIRFQKEELQPLSLGSTILRAETAAIAALVRVFS